MHVLAPKAFEQQNPLNSLLDCYENLLNSIKDNHYKKVILPSLGTGIHGYKHDQISKPLMILLSKFCIDNIFIYEDGNAKIVFKNNNEYLEALKFLKTHNCVSF